MGAKKPSLVASVKKQYVIEDELEVGIGRLIIVYQVSARFLRWRIYCIPFGPDLPYYRTSSPNGRRIAQTGARAHTHAPAASRFGGIVLLCVGVVGQTADMEWLTMV